MNTLAILTMILLAGFYVFFLGPIVYMTVCTLKDLLIDFLKESYWFVWHVLDKKLDKPKTVRLITSGVTTPVVFRAQQYEVEYR